MTKGTCATVVSALVTAGYQPTVYEDSSGAYHISLTVSGVTAATVQTFATAQGITANVSAVDFV